MTPSTAVARSEMERAFYAADAAWNGRFVAAVQTTGIFCRPSCRVRKPLPRNVVFLRDAEVAVAAGYRACLRCHADRAMAVFSRTLSTPLGPMIAAASDAGVCLLEFADRPMLPAQLAAVQRRVGPIVGDGDHPLLAHLDRELSEYCARERSSFSVPLDAPGSSFQARVWEELRRIPYGSTLTYRELASRVGVPTASRAVGRANGSNRLAILIPCHRVIASQGGLGGYGGGLWRKQWLLDLEAAR